MATYVFQDTDEMFSFKWFCCWIGIARQLSGDEEEQKELFRNDYFCFRTSKSKMYLLLLKWSNQAASKC